MGMGFGGRIRNTVAGKRGGIGAAGNMALGVYGYAFIGSGRCAAVGMGIHGIRKFGVGGNCRCNGDIGPGTPGTV